MNRRSLLALSAVGAARASAGCGPRGQPALVVGASASLGDFVRFALRASDDPVLRTATVLEGATATLARQIASGAPMHALVAADRAPWSSGAVAAGMLGPMTVFAEGVLALAWASPPARGLAALGARPGLRFALPNPDLAPFGRAAREALERAGLWASLARKTIVVESVRQALALVDRGEVDAAFTARSLLVTPAPARTRTWVAIDRRAHGGLPHAAASTRACPARHTEVLTRWIAGLRALPPARLAAFGMEPAR
jgi:molybdate transport system substrate-binding protein